MSSQHWIPRPGEDGAGPAHPQCAALCWRHHRGKVEVLLITSRDTGRWIIPKGWPLPDLPPAETAILEAWEEAGVRGTCRAEPMGSFTYLKRMDPGPDRYCLVSVFGLRVQRLERRYPERGLRRRKWFSAEKAARRVAEPELKALILAFQPPADDGAGA